MERHANYALVGVLTSALIIGGLIFAVWLGNFSTAGADHYRIVFRGPVRGLAKGADVQFNGIKVGEVEKIDIVAEDSQLITVDVKVTKHTPVRVDSLASTEMQGITGASAVEITAGTPSRALLKEATREERPVIRSKQSSLTSLLEGGTKIMQGVDEAVQRINRILSDQNVAALNGSIQDLRAVTSDLAANRVMFTRASQAIAKLDRAADDVQGAARSVRTIADGDAKRAASDVSAAARQLRVTLDHANGVMDRIGADVDHVGTDTIPSLDQTLRSVQGMADSLDDFVRQLRRDPRGALGGRNSKELEPAK